ncbi:MAG TPA: flagellar basal body-associated FliL family protein [bacterium]|nr:flagellar basal body-associated FliL family protein [bacterium]HPN43179.1 flagellar basal body-associated FliL family protein [bacterium]
MRENWKKILIFIGLIILQIVLAYVLVTYILPPGRINNATNLSNFDTTQIDDSATVTSSNDSSGIKNKNKLSSEDKNDTTTTQSDQDSSALDESVMVDGLTDYLEEQIPEKELEGAYTFSIEEIIVNPAETRGTRYLVMSLSVIAKGKNLETRLEAKRPAINDAINTLISRKTVLWLSDIDNRPFLREEIKILLETIIGDTKVLRLYFTKYIFQ